MIGIVCAFFHTEGKGVLQYTIIEHAAKTSLSEGNNSFLQFFYNGEQNENYKSTTGNCTNIPKMEAATDIDRLRTFRIVTDVCQHQIFRPGGKSDSGRIYRFITFVTAYGGNIFRNFIAIFGDQYCIESS